MNYVPRILILALFNVAIPLPAMQQSDDQGLAWKKARIVVCAEIATTIVVERTMAQWCPLDGGIFKWVTAGSLGILGAGACLSCFHPETERERKFHDAQFDSVRKEN